MLKVELLPGERPWLDAADHIKSLQELQELEQEKAIEASIRLTFPQVSIKFRRNNNFLIENPCLKKGHAY